METQFVGADSKLNQFGSEIHEQKLKQVVSELTFPSSFAYVPWGHHVMIIQRAKSVEEAVFYIQKEIIVSGKTRKILLSGIVIT